MKNKKIKKIDQSEIKPEHSYQSPEISKISASQINKETSCSCKNHDDNPYQ